ncbi:MAG: Gfo/Idh/MocA family oxidoreductase [bacterium]|nr:Gfo/Idh/MocA family oxidoreductase [bacterium]
MTRELPKICFFGCGDIAGRHAKILKGLYSKIELSFASRDQQKSDEYRQKYKGVNSFGSYAEAAASDTYDIAFITTPHAYHWEIAVEAANNKKDIIIEKPITRNSTELKKILTAVGKNGVRCTVAENYMYKPFIRKVRDYISRGHIGDPLFIEVNKTNRDTTTGWRTDAELMGGGALLEGGVHWVNLLVSLAGSDPEGVIAFKPAVEYDTTVPFEDTLTMQVQFSNGSWGKLLHSWRIPNSLKGIGKSKIYGTEGVISFESNGLFVSCKGKKRGFYITNLFDFLGFKAMHRSLVENYIADKPWDFTTERIAMELKLIESAYKSLKTKKIEKI